MYASQTRQNTTNGQSYAPLIIVIFIFFITGVVNANSIVNPINSSQAENFFSLYTKRSDRQLEEPYVNHRRSLDEPILKESGKLCPPSEPEFIRGIPNVLNLATCAGLCTQDSACIEISWQSATQFCVLQKKNCALMEYANYYVYTVVSPPDCSGVLGSKVPSEPTAIPYNSEGTGVDKITGYTDLFTYNALTGCLVMSCSLMTSGSCATPLPSQSNIELDTASPFKITGKENIIAGYTQQFCYSCSVTGGSVSPVVFTKDALIISATERIPDCSSTLAPTTFLSTAIAYNSAGTGVVKIKSFTDVLAFSGTTGCTVASCSLMKSGDCAVALPSQTNIVFDSVYPFKVTGKNNILAGFTQEFCYSCTVTGGSSTLIFNKDAISISANKYVKPETPYTEKTNTVGRWEKCDVTEDCIMAADACCPATWYNRGGSIKLCGPYSNQPIMLSIDVPKYANYLFDCRITAGDRAQNLILSSLVTIGLNMIFNM